MANPFESVIYLQIRRQWVGALFLGWNGRKSEWTGTPEALFARGKDGRERAYPIQEIGNFALSNGQTFVAFAHPRAFIHDFERTRDTLGLIVRNICRKKTKGVRPIYVVQVLDEWEGGLTDIEHRCLVEICKEIGAGRVMHIEASRELTAPEVLRLVRARRREIDPRPIAIDLRHS